MYKIFLGTSYRRPARELPFAKYSTACDRARLLALASPGDVFTVALQSRVRGPWRTVASYFAKPGEPSWQTLRRWGFGGPGVWNPLGSGQ